MLSGRLSRAAQRSSVAVLRNTRPSSVLFYKQYSTPTQSVEQNEHPLRDVFRQHNIRPDDKNLPLLRAHEMVREAEHIITTKDAFETAEAMLMGALDFMGKNDITDAWLLGSAHANLAYVLQQAQKYEQAMTNYGIGLGHLQRKPKDSRFIGLRQLGFAELLSLQGEHAMAATTCQGAITHLEKAWAQIVYRLGDKDPLVALASNNLASYKVLEGKTKQAVAPAERALGIFMLSLGKHNNTTRSCATNLAKMYKDLGQTEDIEKLDQKFLADDEPILPPVVGKFKPEYLERLKQKWRSQGPRKIFDPPGIHRSAKLSAASYTQFLKSWKNADMPIRSAAANVLSAELKSLTYSHDQLKRYVPRPLPKTYNHSPDKYRSEFEHLKLKGVTSLADELDKQASLLPLSPEDVIITPDEWRAAAERQTQYRAKHGDPTHEAAEDEFARSEEFFDETNVEDSEEGDIADEDVEQDVTGVRAQDEDTYDAYEAVHGDPAEQAYERSKSSELPYGDPSLIEYEESESTDNKIYVRSLKGKDEPDFKDIEAGATDLPWEAPDETTLEGEEGEEELKELESHVMDEDETKPTYVAMRIPQQENEDEDGLGDAIDESLAKYHPLARQARRGQEQNEDETAAGTARFQKKDNKFGTGPSGPNNPPKNNPYAHNPEEDDVFPENNQQDRSRDRTEKEKARDELYKAKKDIENERPKYKYGRLHDEPWHDDNA